MGRGCQRVSDKLVVASSAASLAMTAFMTSTFLRGTSPVSKNLRRSSTWSRSSAPNADVTVSEKQSMREAMEHLLARYLQG